MFANLISPLLGYVGDEPAKVSGPAIELAPDTARIWGVMVEVAHVRTVVDFDALQALQRNWSTAWSWQARRCSPLARTDYWPRDMQCLRS
jgi:hypothetical protein